ncbi:hypothetical protein L9F63_002610, partial [Diploptera punctata]
VVAVGVETCSFPLCGLPVDSCGTALFSLYFRVLDFLSPIKSYNVSLSEVSLLFFYRCAVRLACLRFPIRLCDMRGVREGGREIGMLVDPYVSVVYSLFCPDASIVNYLIVECCTECIGNCLPSMGVLSRYAQERRKPDRSNTSITKRIIQNTTWSPC